MFEPSKELRLDVEALFSQAVYGHGFLHYGYWPNGSAQELSLQALGQAQQAYFDKLVETIPAGTTSILDVGSGTGSNALGLTRRGFQVDCVCPSAKLNAMARAKLPPSSRIFECRFEDLDDPATYDLVLFCESFHYIDAERALAQAARRAGRHMLLFDYFPRRDAGGPARVTHRRFLDLVAAQGRFELLSDVDVTERIAPTFAVLDAVANDHVRPFAARLLEDFRRHRPLLSMLLARPLNRAVLRARRTSERRTTFPLEHEYRLMLLAAR